MSQENVETVRRNYEAFGQGGFDRWMEYWSDDLDYRPAKDDFDFGPIHGKKAMRKHMSDWTDAFDEYWFARVELVVHDRERHAADDLDSAVDSCGVRGPVYSLDDVGTQDHIAPQRATTPESIPGS